MLFNSLEFAVFFILVSIGYWLLPHAQRWWWLLMASCVFYMAFVPVYIIILGATIVIDYFAGLYLEKAQGKARRWGLIASLIANIGVLAVFKYFNWLNYNFGLGLELLGRSNPVPYLEILLPIGLSFHTFQAMSYTIEVYRGNQKAERHFGIYALYVMFYPQLVAGPIERPQNVLHQFYEKHTFNYYNMTAGLKLMAWGLFKKVVIADRISPVTDLVYAHPEQYSGLAMMIATVFFAIQIFCDFSGYSDMALGAAQTMGYRLMLNFDRPYRAQTIAEFWRRWHISLSTWFRDYLYIPLGGNRVGKFRRRINQFIVFMVSGLWHGASWNFVIWGSMHGAYLIAADTTKDTRNRFVNRLGLPQWGLPYVWMQRLAVFVLVCIAWVFFRARTFSDALYINTHYFKGDFLKELGQVATGKNWMEVLRIPFSRVDLGIALAAIALMGVVHQLQERGSVADMIVARVPSPVRYAGYVATVLALYHLGKFTSAQFIYFQF